MTTPKPMPLAEMKARWAIVEQWVGSGLQLCPGCGEKYPVLYSNPVHCKEAQCRSCFCAHMMEATGQ